MHCISLELQQAYYEAAQAVSEPRFPQVGSVYGRSYFKNFLDSAKDEAAKGTFGEWGPGAGILNGTLETKPP